MNFQRLIFFWVFLIFFHLSFLSLAQGASGDLDPSFDFDGIVSTAIGLSSDDEAFAMAQQPDGKIVVVGRSIQNGLFDFALARYNVDGSLDTTFDNDGIVTTPITPSAPDEAYAVAVQSDGKIVVAGRTLDKGLYKIAVARYNTDGILDSTNFGTGGLVITSINPAGNDEAYGIAIQKDQKIVIVGRSQSNGLFDFVLVRYDTTGGLDSSFGSTGVVVTDINPSGNDEAYAIAIQSDDKIVVAGRSQISGNFDVALVRYNSGGSLDLSFDNDGIVTTAIGANGDDEAYAVRLQTDGKIVLAGAAQVSGNFDFAVIRYINDGVSDGTLDSSFDSDGIVTTPIGASADDIARALAIQQDGKIVVGGMAQISGNFDFAVARYRVNGALDADFSDDGVVTTAIGSSADDKAYAMVLLEDERIVMAGGGQISGNFDFALVRYSSNCVGQDEAFALSIQTDGKILAAGCSEIGGDFDFALSRYNTDGTLDNPFSEDGVITTPISINGDDEIFSMALQTDGKIVVAGRSQVSGDFDFALARYRPSGPLDTTFGAGGKVTTAISSSGNDEAFAIAIQSNGKIIAAGRTQTLNGDLDIALARYNSNGSLDASFGTGGIITTPIGSGVNEVFSVVLQSDGKILVAGRTPVSGNFDFAVLRYNSNGSLDTTFGTLGIVTTAISSSGNDEAFGIAIQSDGKIIVAGRSRVSGNFDIALVRLNTDGSLDSSFDSDGKVTTSITANADDEVYGLQIQGDGKIVVSGRTRISNHFDMVVVRYNTDGSLDSSFDGDGIVTTAVSNDEDDEAYALGIQGNGKIIIAGRSRNTDPLSGSFGKFNFAVVVYNTDGSLDTTFGGNGKVTTDFAVVVFSSRGGGSGGCVMNPKGGIDIALMGILAWGAIFLVRKKILKYISNFSNR